MSALAELTRECSFVRGEGKPLTISDRVSKLADSDTVADKVWNELVEIWTPLASSVADIVRI